MNKPLNLRRSYPSAQRITVPCLLLALGCLLASPLARSHAQLFQSDDFNDGNDAGWTRYDPFGGLGANIVQWSYPNGGYRIQTLAPSPNPGLAGPGRGGSLRSESYTDFYISVDIVNWNNALPQAVGILARVKDAGLGTTTGYAFTWSRGNPASDTAGSVDISTITGETPDGVDFTGNDQIHLEPGKAYRLVFIGRGPTLEGRVYELPDTTTPKIDVIGTDPTYDSGAGGLVIYDNSSGATNVCDVTFDNFYATDIEPPVLKVAVQPFGDYELSWPLEAFVYVLQRSTVLTGAVWEDVPQLEVLNLGDRYAHYFNPESDGPNTRFYRLIRRPLGNN